MPAEQHPSCRDCVFGGTPFVRNGFQVVPCAWLEAEEGGRAIPPWANVQIDRTKCFVPESLAEHCGAFTYRDPES